MATDINKRELRIVLDHAATTAFETMIKRMKEATPTVKVQPSQFVSFLICDFLEAHFETDLPVLTAEFFDSDSYYEAERKLAKGQKNYEELMASALDRAQKIKGKKRKKAKPRRGATIIEMEEKAP